MTDNSQRGSTSIERWFDHVVRAVTVIAIVGGAVTLSEIRTQVAVLSTQIETLQSAMADMRTASADRYTRTDARSDLQPVMDRLADHEGRLRSLERGQSPLSP